jgi:2-keto-4-pentenoate hydratase
MTATDPFADALWSAREGRAPIADVQAWRDVDHAMAAAIAADLYRRAGVAESSDAVAAWKMGALDEPTRQRLGLLGPLVAPVLPEGLRTGVREVRLSLADLVAPKVEAELGVLLEEGRTRLVPCVEVADCRFPGWEVPPGCAVADFGLQGVLVFGNAADSAPDVNVTVRHDGSVVGEATGLWDDVLGRLALLPGRLRSSIHVATGSVTPMFPATAGTWEFDFAGAGHIVLHLT